ncbi:MAG TPA: LTA synthase family protein, partial [Opitutaceae bacterium]
MSLPVPSPVAPRSVAASLFEHRHGSLILFYLLFVGVSLATRVLLLVTAAPEVAWDASLLGAFALGLVFDLGAAALASLPLLLALTVLPAGFFQRAWARLAAYAVAAVLVY